MGIRLTVADLIHECGPPMDVQCHDCPFKKLHATIQTDYVKDGKFMCHNYPLKQCKGFAATQPRFEVLDGPYGPRIKCYSQNC